MAPGRLTLLTYMRILLDCIDLSTDPLKEEKRLSVRSCVEILAGKQGVEWLFLVDRGKPDVLPAGLGLRIPVYRRIPGRLGRRIWVRWQLPRLVSKYHPDRVMTTDEIALAPGAADERYAPLTVEEKEEIKRRYADGKEYFLAGVAGARPEEIVDLLKAFSLFKKRQRSNMQLVLGGMSGDDRGKIADEDAGSGAGGSGRRQSGLTDKLATYKYRMDVHVSDRTAHGAGYGAGENAGDDWGSSRGEEEWRKLVAAAYAVVLLFGKDDLGLSILNAWKAETPVIAVDAARLQERGGTAALYTPSGDPASLAALLMSLYTNESLRAGLVAKGRDRVRSFDWERTARQVWEGILRAKDQ